MQGIIHNNPGVITGRISGGGVLTGRLSPGTGGGQPSELPEINIFNHGDYNWLCGTGWRATRHPGNSHYIVTNPFEIYSVNSNNEIYIYGYNRGHIRQAFIIPYFDSSKTKFKMIVTVTKHGTYNYFGFCVGDGINNSGFDEGYYSNNVSGINNPSTLCTVTDVWHDKDISVTREQVEVPIHITTGYAVIFFGQCDNDTTIHEMWFE